MRSLFAAVLVATLVAACGGGGPPAQTTPARDDMVGTTTGGSTTGPQEQAGEFDAKGATGIVRAAAVAADSLAYDVSLIDLGPPYALRAVLGNETTQTDVYTVATSRGVANITPLTSLVVAQLYGQDPGAIYDSFGSGGSVDLTRITDDNLAAAQAGVVAYLASDVGFTVPEGLGSFITTPFAAQAGDPLYDTVVALGQNLAQSGSSFDKLTANVAFASSLCLAEKISISVAGAASDFCPQSKTATPRAGDPQFLTDVFTDRHGNTLTLVIDGDSIDTLTYTLAGGGGEFACAATACQQVTLGPVQGDGTRTVAFDGTTLPATTGTGSAVLQGTVTTAIPGVKLPVLPCHTEWFILIFSDDTVVGRCADPDPFGLGLGGVPGALIGVDVSRGDYEFAAVAGTDRTNAQVSVITDGDGPVLAVQFEDDKPGTFTPRRRFVCLLSACTGTSLGDVTVNLMYGSEFPYYLRTVTFDHTPLVGVDDDGVPTGDTAVLLASLIPAYPLPVPPIEYPPLAVCADGLNALPILAAGASFNACVPDGRTTVKKNGDIELDATDVFSADDQLSIVVHADGTVASATLTLAAVPGPFSCTLPCTGISVAPPAGDGSRRVTFDRAALAEEFFGFPGPRTVAMQPASLVFAPPS